MGKLIIRTTPPVSVDRALKAAIAMVGVEGAASRDEIAANMGASPGSGDANNTVTAARMFNLLSKSKDGYTLTALGRRLAGDPRDSEALIESILAVRAYKLSLDGVHGGPVALSDAQLDSIIEGLDVLPRERHSAGLVLRRSLDYVRRLDGPPLAKTPMIPSPPPRKRPADEQASDSAAFREQPTVAALLTLPPNVGSVWPREHRKAWFDALAGVIELLYGRPV